MQETTKEIVPDFDDNKIDKKILLLFSMNDSCYSSFFVRGFPRKPTKLFLISLLNKHFSNLHKISF